MDNYPWIKKPTLLLDPAKARRNIHQMVAKAHSQDVRLRPHFKTHQSAQVGEFFREESIAAITVSSVEMGAYFARHGWKDILVAFPVNVREIDEINVLAKTAHLGLLIESTETMRFLGQNLKAPVDVWIKWTWAITAPAWPGMTQPLWRLCARRCKISPFCDCAGY